MLSKLFLGHDPRDIRAAVSYITKNMLFVLMVISIIVSLFLGMVLGQTSGIGFPTILGLVFFLFGSWICIYLETKFQKIYREADERILKRTVSISVRWK